MVLVKPIASTPCTNGTLDELIQQCPLGLQPIGCHQSLSALSALPSTVAISTRITTRPHHLGHMTHFSSLSSHLFCRCSLSINGRRISLPNLYYLLTFAFRQFRPYSLSVDINHTLLEHDRSISSVTGPQFSLGISNIFKSSEIAESKRVYHRNRSQRKTPPLGFLEVQAR